MNGVDRVVPELDAAAVPLSKGFMGPEKGPKEIPLNKYAGGVKATARFLIFLEPFEKQVSANATERPGVRPSPSPQRGFFDKRCAVRRIEPGLLRRHLQRVAGCPSRAEVGFPRGALVYFRGAESQARKTPEEVCLVFGNEARVYLEFLTQFAPRPELGQVREVAEGSRERLEIGGLEIRGFRDRDENALFRLNDT